MCKQIQKNKHCSNQFQRHFTNKHFSYMDKKLYIQSNVCLPTESFHSLKAYARKTWCMLIKQPEKSHLFLKISMFKVINWSFKGGENVLKVMAGLWLNPFQKRQPYLPLEGQGHWWQAECQGRNCQQGMCLIWAVICRFKIKQAIRTIKCPWTKYLALVLKVRE